MDVEFYQLLPIGTHKLAYKTLGVVFGGLVTSPLYVYPSMRLKSPIEDDYLGIYSIMFWTLSLIWVIKYACIALRADDHGEGGTFVLYSLLCRNLDIGILSSKRWVFFFEKSVVAKRVWLFIAMLGMCMLIGDGILAPQFLCLIVHNNLLSFIKIVPVLSVMNGIRAPFPSVSKSLVEVLSAVVLIVLFLLQKYGTSRVSFIFSPIMCAWTVTTLIGIYSIIRHYPSIFNAISPNYIVSFFFFFFFFFFFLRNGKEGWLLLVGTVICITGSEALFADLAFLFTTYPSLVLTYAGQTAYLIKNPNDHDDGFYKSIPKTIYWPMFIVATLAAIVASQSLISATFSIIRQSATLDYFPRVKVVHTSSKKEGEVYCPKINYILMILCVAVILIFGDGKDIGNAFVMIMIWRTPPVLVALYFIVYFVMEGVYVSAVSTKILQDRDRLRMLLSDPKVHRVPGVCFFYTNIEDGLTPILEHYIKNMKSLHKVTIFTTFRYLLVPRVAPHERIVVSKLGLKGAYRCVVQYSYADSLDLKGDDFVSQVIDRLRAHIQNGSDYATSVTFELEEEMSDTEEAKLTGVVHVWGKTRFYVSKNCGWFDGYMLAFYEPAMGVPLL
ncbi:hypothetical protein CsSME_00042830 [Camellia sinensis var. sinensis]